jgi:hypothetical protein
MVGNWRSGATFNEFGDVQYVSATLQVIFVTATRKPTKMNLKTRYQI